MADSKTVLLNKIEEHRKAFDKAGQSQVFRFLDKLSTEQELQVFLNEISRVDLEEVTHSYEACKVPPKEGFTLKPFPDVAQLKGSEKDREKWEHLGYKKIAEGKVATLLLAGGQGTRLGSSEPKGKYNIGLPSGKSLYQLQAERLLALQKAAAASEKKEKVHIYWLIMLSDATKEPTEKYFQENKFFGLDPAYIIFFVQDMIPSITPEGKIILTTKNQIAWNPNGNGGLYLSLKKSGALAKLEKEGVEYVFQYCVDNALVKMADPTIIGFAAEKGVDCVPKVSSKLHPDESVGVFALKDGIYGVVEYSEIDKKTAHAVDEKTGQLLYNWAHLCMNLYSVKYLREIVDSRLIYHVAKKKIPEVNEKGETITPSQINGWKLEMFIFDAFEKCKSMILFEVERNEEFSPLKNATGPDSPETCRQMVSTLHKNWLLKAGANVQHSDDVKSLVEISPFVSFDGRHLESFKGKSISVPVELH